MKKNAPELIMAKIHLLSDFKENKTEREKVKLLLEILGEIEIPPETKKEISENLLYIAEKKYRGDGDTGIKNLFRTVALTVQK